MTNKPIFIETDIWANLFTELDPNIIAPDTTLVSNGWQYGQRPPYNVVNYQQRVLSEYLVHLNQNGIIAWDAETTYNSGSYAKYNNAIVSSR